ncbi:MAG: hypothetical protein ABFR62_11885 [Bacteroidota bacterium]
MLRKFSHILILIFIATSCTHDVYRVIKYSDYDKDTEDYSDYFFPKDEYYVVKNSNYYYVKADTVLHFKKILYQGVENGFHRTLVKDDADRTYFLDAYVDIGYYDDEYVYVDVIDTGTKEQLFRFVLDWKNRMKDLSLNERIAELDK